MNVQDHGNGCHIEYAGGVDQTSHPRKQSTRREPMQTISVLLVLGLSAVAMTTPAVGGYRLVQTIAIAGDDGWDHPTVDSAARRLYVTHGTHVVVIDVDSGKLGGQDRQHARCSLYRNRSGTGSWLYQQRRGCATNDLQYEHAGNHRAGEINGREPRADRL